MQVSELLAAAGIQQRHNRFPCPPGDVFAVWDDAIRTDGPDGMPPCIFTHDVTIEVYESRPDDAKISALESVLTAQGLHWSKQDRYWIQSEQFYQAIYEFTYIEKRRA